MSSLPSIDKFTELEDRILSTIELIKVTRSQKERAEKELAVARSQMIRLEREVEQLRRERDLIKNKVESLLEKLSEMTEGSLA
jgi:chromosome segregation ATPase